MPAEFPVDQIIVSANENWLYLDFWPFVAWAYRVMFPHVRIRLAFVSERTEGDPFVAQLRTHGDVVLLRPLRGIPQAAQAKMARYFVAASQKEAVCYIEDIDWIPIDREWYAGKVQKRRPGSLLLVGHEVYGVDERGQAPASMMTGEGDLYRRLFNPDGLAWEPWLRSFCGRKERHCDFESRVQHEGLGCTTDDKHLGNQLFSDEALVVQLRRERPVPVTPIVRGYNVGTDTIDRCCWAALDREKLRRGGYLGAHTGRPYLEHREGNDAIVSYLAERYGVPAPAPLEKRPGVDPDMTFSHEADRAIYSWICENVSPATAVLEIGSGHVTTNYLSRYFELRTVEHDLALVNLYPAFYLYAPLRDGGYDPEWIERGFGCYNTYRPHGLLLVNEAVGMASCFPRLPLQAPVIIRAEARDTTDAIVARAGRRPKNHGAFAVV